MKNKKIHQKGFTLPEIMVYITLVAILLSGVATLLISSIKYHKTAERIADLQHNALIALTNLSNDLSESQGDAIYRDENENNWLLFPSPKNITTGGHSFDDSGSMYWQKWVAYYIETDNDGVDNLVKKEMTLNPMSIEPGVPPANDLIGIKQAQGSVRVIARGVEEFTVTQGANGNSYIISVVIDRTTDTTKANKINARTEIAVMN